MENEKTNSLGPFGNLNIEDIEEGLGLIMPSSGERSVSKTKETKGKQESDLTDLSNLIEIPETEEERIQLEKKQERNTTKKESIEDVEEAEESGEEVKDEPGEEDALITEDSPLYLHAATLHEEGILPSLDLSSLKGKKYSEAFQLYLDAQNKYIEEGRNEYKNSLSERQKNFLELIEKGIPQEQAEHQFTIEDSYGKITDEVLSDDEELQKQIIIQYHQLKELSEKKINILIKAAVDDERLFEEAKEARDSINAYIADQRKVMLKQAEEEERQAGERENELKTRIKTTIDSVNEILPGIKISASEKTRLFELMTKPVETRVINGQKVPINLINKIRSEDRVLFDLRLNYFIEQGMFKKEFDLSKLNKKLTSTAAQKLAAKLKDETGGPSGKGLTNESKKKESKPQNIIFPSLNYKT